MGTYKNDYKKEEDECLWELHEIRHKLMNEYKNKSVDEINKKAKQILFDWKKKNKKISASA